MPFVKRVNTKNLPLVTDARKIFIGRTDELHFFVEHVLQPEDPSYNIISISGEGGVGKSTLLARFIDNTCQPPFKDYCLTAFVDEQQTTPYTVMEKFATQLGEAGAPLLEFEKALTRYKEALRKLQIMRETAQDTAVRETVDLVGMVAEGVPAVGGVLHKGANIATELYLHERRTRQMLKDAELLEEPLSDLTQVFVEELNHITDKQIILSSGKLKRSQRVILFFDTFEQLSSEIAPWLLDHLLQANISTNVVITVAGRDSIEHSTPSDPKRWLPYRDSGILYLMNLNNFTEDETRAYLAERGFIDPNYIAIIWQLSKGLPLYLSLLTFNPQGKVDPTANVVANFLRWIPEHEHIKRRVALDAALFSKSFNQDDLAAFTYLQEEERATLYRWLTRLPFVRSNTDDGRYRYHDLAQEMFRRDLYQRSQKEYYATRQALATYYRQLLEHTQKEESKENNSFAEHLEITLALAYQLFYLPDQASHIEGIELISNAYKDLNWTIGYEIARFLRDLPSEQQSGKMSINGLHIARDLLQFIEASIEHQQQQKLVEATNVLLKKITQHSAFSSTLSVWLYNLRGEAYKQLKQYQQAIADQNRAIELDPTYARAYYQRGDTYWCLKEYQQAIADYDRAIELALTSADYYHDRGFSYFILEEYQRAIADYDRAIELAPTSARYYRNRGEAYMKLKEHQRAIADYDRAIELAPAVILEYYYHDRGEAYMKLKEHQRAIADYDRAIELAPSSSFSYCVRGNAYKLLKEYQRALTDYDRAIELDPTTPSYYAVRGIAYRRLKEYQQAIANYNSALSLDPNNAWVYDCRGIAYWWLKDLQLAKADFIRAQELDSSDPDPRFRIVWSDMCQERLDQIMAKRLEVITAIDPQHYTAYLCRGIVMWLEKRFEEALAEFEQAIALEPEGGDAYFFWKGIVYASQERDEESIVALEKALETDLPPILLAPIRWLKDDRLDFYNKYAMPLLTRYDM